MEHIKRIIDFRNILRNNLTEHLKYFGYNLSYDNQNQNSKDNLIFELQYTGRNVIKIYNDDWRDYIEYFKVKVNDKELFIVNLNNYENIDTAYELIKSSLFENIN